MAWRVPSLNGQHRHKKGWNSKISVPITKPMTRQAWWALKKFKNLIWGQSYGRLKKSCDESEFFLGYPLSNGRYDLKFWRNHKISKPRINLMLLATCWFLKFLDSVKFWCRNGRLKEATLKKTHFCHNFFSNAHNLGPNWAFWTFSVLSTLVWSLAWWWAQKFLNFDLYCARGGRSKRVPVKPFLPILSVFTPKS